MPTHSPNLQWLTHDLSSPQALNVPTFDALIHLAPIWYLSPLLTQLNAPYPKHIIAISSTSLITKQTSSSPYEQATVQRLSLAEQYLIDFATQHQIAWTIVRPTLIYAQNLDKNISHIARFIRYFGFFPLIGNGQGLRQPIHAEDIALACIQILNHPTTVNKTYHLTGSETLTYKQMVNKIFTVLKRKPHFINLPPPLLAMVLTSLSLIPRYRHLTSSMGERMNQDLIFSSEAARQDFGFSARPFQPLT